MYVVAPDCIVTTSGHTVLDHNTPVPFIPQSQQKTGILNHFEQILWHYYKIKPNDSFHSSSNFIDQLCEYETFYIEHLTIKTLRKAHFKSDMLDILKNIYLANHNAWQNKPIFARTVQGKNLHNIVESFLNDITKMENSHTLLHM